MMTQRERIVRYILGQQTEDERQQIEQEYFADVAFLSEVQAVCDELMDAYLHDRMSAGERERFAQRLHALPFLHERVKTERALLHWANAAPLPVVAKQRWLVAHLWGQMNMAWLLPRAFALLLLLGLCAGIWYVTSKRDSSPSPQLAQGQTSPAASVQPTVVPTGNPRPSVSGLPPAATRSSVEKKALPVIATILLSTDMVRSAGEVATLSVPRQDGIIRLQLELPSHTRQTYQAVLQTPEHQPLKTWHQLSPRRYETDWVITLSIPAELLDEGEYMIELHGTATTPYNFQFRVQKN